MTLRNVYEGFYHDYYDGFLEDYVDNKKDLEPSSKDKIVSDFYNVAFKGGKLDDACNEAWTLYREYSGKNLYDPEIWPEIFDKILGEKFIKEDEEGFLVYNFNWWDKKEVGSYEEIYRDIMGWESDTLDFRDVWNKFYKYYIEMEEALDKYGCREDN